MDILFRRYERRSADQGYTFQEISEEISRSGIYTFKEICEEI